MATTIQSITDGNEYTGDGAADTIAAGDGNNTINAAAGANTITADHGDNTITAEGGADTITLGSGDNEITAGAGANTITTQKGYKETGTSNTVKTLEGADTISVGNGNNVIKAGSGANTITAGNGNNEITGGAGIDTITVGNGDNKIIAGSLRANTITAGSGSNEIEGGSGIDTVTAMGDQSSTNTIDVGDGTNTVTTGDEMDIITAGSDGDTITSGGGNDEVYSGGGSDTVALGDGDDTEYYTMDDNKGAIDTFAGGNGADALSLIFTDEEWESEAVQADITRFQEQLASVEAAPAFDFSGFNLSVTGFEKLLVSVGGGGAVDLTVAQRMPFLRTVDLDDFRGDAPTEDSVRGNWGVGVLGDRYKLLNVDPRGVTEGYFGYKAVSAAEEWSRFEWVGEYQWEPGGFGGGPLVTHYGDEKWIVDERQPGLGLIGVYDADENSLVVTAVVA